MNDLFSSVFALPSSSREEEQQQEQMNNMNFTPIKKENGSLDRFASSFMTQKRQHSNMMNMSSVVMPSFQASAAAAAAASENHDSRGDSLVSDLDRVLDILDTAEDIIGPTTTQVTPPQQVTPSNQVDPFSMMMLEPTPLGPQGVQQVHSHFGPSFMTESLSMDLMNVFGGGEVEQQVQLEQVEQQEPAPKRRRTSKQQNLSPSAVLSSSSSASPVVVPSSSSSPTTRSVSPSSSTSSTNDEDRFRPYQSDQWKDRFDDLVAYKEKNGNCLVPHNFPENQQLAQWIKRQRYQFKLKSNGRHSTLTEERLSKLNELGFVWDSHKAAWLDKFEDLKKFYHTYQHCSVPSNYKDRSLAIWVKCQRRQWKLYQQNSRSTMNIERFQQLDVLGFDWNPRNL